MFIECLTKEDYPKRIAILISEIATVYEDETKKMTCVVLKSGPVFTIPLTYDVVMGYWKQGLTEYSWCPTPLGNSLNKVFVVNHSDKVNTDELEDLQSK